MLGKMRALSCRETVLIPPKVNTLFPAFGISEYKHFSMHSSPLACLVMLVLPRAVDPGSRQKLLRRKKR